MLLRFSFSNFRSFRDDTVLDLTATKMTELNNHIISVANEKVLPVAAIFGANASGKSNIQHAFTYMHTYVLESLEYGGSTDSKREESEFPPPTPFLLENKSRDDASSFETYFTLSVDNPKIYNYGFVVDKKGIVEEWLNYATKSGRMNFKSIFYRNRDEKILDLAGLGTRYQENIKLSLEPETLIVTLGAKLKITKLKNIRDWFWNNEAPDFGHPFENYFLSRQLPENFVDDVSVQNDVVKYFSAFDPSIIGFDIKKSEIENDRKRVKYSVNALHKMNDSNETISIPLSEESAGSLKMFALYPFLHNILECGGVLFVDELNARLHPLLVRTFIVMFLNPETNPKHAQLIFTTHDAWQLSNKTLRRDEIWFVEKGDNGVSTLFSLADFVDDDGTKIRKDENLEKNYLLGKYGAIPLMKSFQVLKGDK